jgi:hypothetical protein
MADSYELRKGDRVLGVVDDDIATEVAAAVARENLEKDLRAIEEHRDDEEMGCDC